MNHITDAFIAKEVLGWKQHQDHKGLWCDGKHMASPFIPLPQFTTRTDDAIIVLEHINSGDRFCMEVEQVKYTNSTKLDYSCFVYTFGGAETVCHVIEPTMAAAICRGACAALGLS
jgi:hypothetical protein